RVESFIARGEPILFALPGFPAKSPNRYKVLGCEPDMAEWLALGFLQSLCDRIRSEYEPGARVVICSDGRVFSDLLGIPDADVTRYQTGIASMIEKMGARDLSLFNMEGEFGAGGGFDEMRRKLMERHSEPLEAIREAVRRGGDAASLYRGLARVLLEDSLGPDNREPLSVLRKLCRERTYGVIQRSKAWGALVAGRFPEVIRLSIHPQPCGSGKLGLHFLETTDNWLTPWHGVAVKLAGGGFVLMPRRQAEKEGATVVRSEEFPVHFVAPPSFSLSQTPTFGAG
ncbi:MAG TPA: isocyanide synthase family protein, partial [Myxococcaceae bacterium]|nr:isocyanide synthase family protein [Myxococcaceae bacterium]